MDFYVELLHRQQRKQCHWCNFLPITFESSSFVMHYQPFWGVICVYVVHIHRTPAKRLKQPSAIIRLTAHCTLVPCVCFSDFQLCMISFAHDA